MDLIEHLHDPETFMDELRRKSAGHRPEVMITSANVAFLRDTRRCSRSANSITAVKAFSGSDIAGCLPSNRLRALLEQAGYEVLEERGVPAPFPLAIGMNVWSRCLLFCNRS